MWILIFVSFSVILTVTCLPLRKSSQEDTATYPFPFVSKAEWGGAPPTAVTSLETPVSTVVIHHSYIPGACKDRSQCMEAMRSMQSFHQGVNHWADIGYNFAVGGDGAVYEGRGWRAVGAHAVGVNAQSIGIVLIGDWIDNAPPQIQLEVTKQLIASGVDLGFISADYALVGHRQVGTTECPGEALFEEINNWRHFDDGFVVMKRE